VVTLKFADGERGALVDPPSEAQAQRPKPAPRAAKPAAEQGDLF
jgi:hypothetical protein